MLSEREDNQRQRHNYITELLSELDKGQEAKLQELTAETVQNVERESSRKRKSKERAAQQRHLERLKKLSPEQMDQYLQQKRLESVRKADFKKLSQQLVADCQPYAKLTEEAHRTIKEYTESPDNNLHIFSSRMRGINKSIYYIESMLQKPEEQGPFRGPKNHPFYPLLKFLDEQILHYNGVIRNAYCLTEKSVWSCLEATARHVEADVQKSSFEKSYFEAGRTASWTQLRIIRQRQQVAENLKIVILNFFFSR